MSMQALPALPEALSIIEFGGRSTPGSRAAGAEAAAREEAADRSSGLYLLIGLQNGVLLRTVLDSVTGDLSDTRTRYLGAKPVKLLRVRVLGADAVCPLSVLTLAGLYVHLCTLALRYCKRILYEYEYSMYCMFRYAQYSTVY